MAKKGQPPKSKFWTLLERIGDFRILSISVGGWGCILSIVLLIGGLAALIIRENSTSTQETVVAEIMWTNSELYVDSHGSSKMIYRVRLKQDEKEYTCRISPVLAKLWQSLEQGKQYEFSISRTRTRCFIFEATALDSTDYLFE